MGKYKRAGYLFYTWEGDHAPRHVHVLKNDRLVCKWNLEKQVVLDGKADRKIKKAIKKLQREGKI